MKVTIGYAAPGAATVSATLDGQTVVFSGSPQEAVATLGVPRGRHMLDWFITGEPQSEYQVAVDDVPPVEGELPDAGSASGTIRFEVGGRRRGSPAIVLAIAAAAAVVAAIILAGRRSE